MRSPALFAVLVIAAASGAQEYRPAPSPLMTRWGQAVTPEDVHREYPRPTLVRKDWLNLNGLWQFSPGKEGESPPIGRDLSQHILVPFPVESALSGVGSHVERMWYRRTFTVPEPWRMRRILLHLDAVDWEASVFVNGRAVGAHRGGYDRCSLDITEALTPEGPQELIVGVWDPTDAHWQPRGKQVLDPRGIWYTPSSGIWQTVWMEPVNETHVRAIRVRPDAVKSAVIIDADMAGPQGERHFIATVFRDGTAVGEVSGDSLPLVVPVREPALWTPDHPTIYDVRLVVTLRPGSGRSFDTVHSYTAFREVSVSPDEGGRPVVQLNGRPVFLVGPLDQGFWPDGLYAPPSDDAIRFDIETMKRLGFNAARKHVKVESERWYYWADRLGLLVLQDMPSGDGYIGGDDPDIARTSESAAQFNLELRRLIEDRSRHPSIIAWVIFNEGWGQSDTESNTDLVKRLDPTRLVISASGWTDRGTGDVLDLHTYPGPGPVPPAPQWGRARACLLGEFGGLGLGIDGHTWQDRTWGYKGAADRDDLTGQYVELLRRLWALREQGLSGGIYTQLTDVETEANGLLTYDRALLKVDPDRVARANRGLFPRLHDLLVTSQQSPSTWRYSESAPPDGWHLPEFDDSAWSEGPAGFGRPGTPGAVVRTQWLSPAIWIRRPFTVERPAPGDVALLVHHDEDAEVYLNGVLAASVKGYTTGYTVVPVRAEAAATLRRGINTLAVHCRQTVGGQYIDVGLVELIDKDE